MDALRLRARLLNHWRTHAPHSDRLHLGCGARKIPGWFNVDIRASELDMDLSCGRLPLPDSCFSAVVSQQVIEHLWLDTELLPLLRELKRVCKSDAELWLACPDMEQICRSYLEDGGEALLRDRVKRWPEFSLVAPAQHMLNMLFYQQGEHKNLFDYSLLKWAVHAAGFRYCERRVEADLLRRFPEFPTRADDACSVYVEVRA